MEKSHINTHYSKQDIQNLINKNNCLDSNKLRKTTLTTQLAYNIFYEIKEIPKCSGCQKDLRFGSFKTGYGTCGDRSCSLEKAKTKARKQIGISQKQKYSKYLEDDVINNPKSIQYLDVNGCKHRYHPDCKTNDDILYEVKSPYTFEEGKKNNVLYNKIKYSLKHCEKYVLIIYEKDGSEIDRRVFTKNNIVSLNYLKVV